MVDKKPKKRTYAADFVVQSVLHRLAVPLVDLGRDIILVRHVWNEQLVFTS